MLKIMNADSGRFGSFGSFFAFAFAFAFDLVFFFGPSLLLGLASLAARRIRGLAVVRLRTGVKVLVLLGIAPAEAVLVEFPLLDLSLEPRGVVVAIAVAVGAVDDGIRASLSVDVYNLELLGGEEGDEVLELALGDGVELVHGAVAHGDGHVERALRRRARPRVPLKLNLRHLRVREEHRGFGEVEEGLLQRVEVAHLSLVARLDGVPARRGRESALPRELHPGHRLEQPR